MHNLGPVPEELRHQVPREIIEANDISYLEGRLEKLEGEPLLEAVLIDGKRLAMDGGLHHPAKGGQRNFRTGGPQTR